VKKPFYARVLAFTNAVARKGPQPHLFTLDARVTDSPDAHMHRLIRVQLHGTRQARQLGESLIAWADEKDRDGEDNT
jgi:hypothetical protein